MKQETKNDILIKKNIYIYFFTKNFKTRKSSKKLNYVKVKSFLIKKTKRSINYELDLLKNVKVFLVFYILLLKLTNSITSLQDTFYFHLQKEKQYKIEKILQQENQKYFIFENI